MDNSMGFGLAAGTTRSSPSTQPPSPSKRRSMAKWSSLLLTLFGSTKPALRRTDCNQLLYMPHKSVTFNSLGKLFFPLLVWASMVPAVLAKEAVLRTEANVMVELTLRAQRNYADPFNDV